jgi:hypothetical protein
MAMSDAQISGSPFPDITKGGSTTKSTVCGSQEIQVWHLLRNIHMANEGPTFFLIQIFGRQFRRFFH